MATTKRRKTAAPRPARTGFSDELRTAIEPQRADPYAIARDAGIDPGIISRFMAGLNGLTTTTLDRLAPVLGIHVGVTARARGRPRNADSAPTVSLATAEGNPPDDAVPSPQEGLQDLA